MAAVHVFWGVRTRSNADEVVQLVSGYLKVHGQCAPSLEDLDITREQLISKVGISGYYCDAQGKPSFSYGFPFVLFDTHTYDFDRGVWEYTPD